MRNFSIFIVTVVAMFLAVGCYVIPNSGDELNNNNNNNNGYDYEPVSDDEVSDETVKDDVVNDNTQADETADEDVVEDDIDVDNVDTDTASDNDVVPDDEDLTVSISAPEKINENGGVAEVYVTLNRAEKYDIYASFSFGGDAIRNTDYVVGGLNGDKLEIPAGEKSAKFQLISVNNERNDGNREIVVSLDSSNYFEIKTKEARVTILEDDGTFNGEFNFESVSATITENSSSDTATITVKRSVSTDKVAVTVVATGDLSRLTFNPSGDYLNGKEVEFLHGESVKTFTVKVGNDNIAQPELKVNFKLRTPTGNTTIGSNKEFNLTVKDDDGGTEKEVQTASGPTNYCTDWYIKPDATIKSCGAWGAQGSEVKIIDSVDGNTKFLISGWCSAMCYDANGNPSAQFEAGGDHSALGDNTKWYQEKGCSSFATWNGDPARKCQ